MIPLTNDELRGLVRDAIARVRATPPAGPSAAPPARSLDSGDLRSQAPAAHVHASQAIFILGPGGDADGNCIIEPAVRCTHCGYCQSYGH